MMAKELRSLGSKELRAKVKELREEIFWLKFKNKSGQVDKAASIEKTRRDLARVLTVMNEKGAEKSPKAGE